MSIKGTRAAIASERKRVRAKVQPEIDAAWAEMEARHAKDTIESRAIVAAHQQQEAINETARRKRVEAEEAAYQEILTGSDESVLLLVGSRKTRPGGSPESKEGRMPKNDKKSNGATKAAAKPKAEKKGAFCLMTGKQTTGARFSGLGTDAKYKSLLVNTALGDPKGEAVIYDHETGVQHTKPAIEILKSLNWIGFLDKARASRKAKSDSVKAKKAEKPVKKAAGSTAAA